MNTTHSNEMLTHLADLEALFIAVEQYQQAALASAPAPSPDVLSMTPAQLSAYRKANPVYRLGWVAGHRVGVAQAEQNHDCVHGLYAQHAILPGPFDCSPLMKRVQLLLEFWKNPTQLSVERLNTLHQQLADCSGNSQSVWESLTA